MRPSAGASIRCGWPSSISTRSARCCRRRSASPAAVGARTERIKIGIAVQVLPLCHPLRLAEEAATVDHISGGRLIFGVGRSGLPRTYEDYGVSYAESRDRFTEVLDIVELAWSQPGFSYEGKYYNFKNITVAPKPLQKPLSADPDSRREPRHLSRGRRARAADLHQRPLRLVLRIRPGDPGLSRSLRRGGP